MQNSIGAVPGPLDCFLVHRGLRTLHLRMAAHTENARVVVGWLRGRRGRLRRALARDLGDGLVPASGRGRGSSRATKVFSLAESLGGVESLIEVPQAMTHQSVEGSGGRRAGRSRAALVRDRGAPRISSRTSRRPSALTAQVASVTADGVLGGNLYVQATRVVAHPRWMRRIALTATTAGLATLGGGYLALGAAGQDAPRRCRAAATIAAGRAADRRRGLASAAARRLARQGRRSRSRARRRAGRRRRAPIPGLTRDRRQAHQGRLRGRARQEPGAAAAPTPSTRRSRSATASRCRRWRRPRRSSRSSRPATASRARPTSGAAGTASGRTRATTARARSRSRSPPRGC